MSETEALFDRDCFVTNMGKVRTKTLFLELSYVDPRFHIFTLKDEDCTNSEGKHLYSLKKLYLSLTRNDPTEYTFAETIFGSWKIWEAIRKSPDIIPHVEAWRKETEVRIKSDAIKAIAEEMNEGGRSSFTAAKLLLEKGWLENRTATEVKARLKKEEQEKEDQKALELLGEDASRLGLKVN